MTIVEYAETVQQIGEIYEKAFAQGVDKFRAEKDENGLYRIEYEVEGCDEVHG